MKAGINADDWSNYVQKLDQWIQYKHGTPEKDHRDLRNKVGEDEYRKLKYKVALAAAVVTTLKALVDFKSVMSNLYTDKKRSIGHRLLMYFANNIPEYKIMAPKNTKREKSNHVHIEPVYDGGYEQQWNNTHMEKSIKAKARFYWRLFINDFNELFKGTPYTAEKAVPRYGSPLLPGAISVTVDTTHQLNFRVQLPYQMILGNNASEKHWASIGTFILREFERVAENRQPAQQMRRANTARDLGPLTKRSLKKSGTSKALGPLSKTSSFKRNGTLPFEDITSAENSLDGGSPRAPL